jgi:hypothetical protein
LCQFCTVFQPEPLETLFHEGPEPPAAADSNSLKVPRGSSNPQNREPLRFVRFCDFCQF